MGISEALSQRLTQKFQGLHKGVGEGPMTALVIGL